MKTHIKFLVTFSLILFLCNAAFPGEDIIIESRLFKGTQHERLSQEEIIISSLSEPFIVPVRSSDIENEKWTVESIQRELRNLYQLRQVDHLASANMIWDGKKKNLTKTIMLESSLLPIEFYPEIVSDQNANLRIRVTQMFGEGMKLTADSMGLEKERMAWVISGPLEISSSEMNVRELLDTEITLNFNQSVVLGFPINGTSYFLEVRINFKKEARNFSGVKDKYKEYTEMVKTDMDFLQPPNPVREVRPVYPAKCKEKNIEGAVILQVGIDEEGNVIDVELLKGAHKNLDQAAVEALRLWKYQPVKKDEEPVPVTFTVTVDFKLRKPISNQNAQFTFEYNEHLENILRKCAEYCERVKSIALFYVCREEIQDKINYYLFSDIMRISPLGGIRKEVVKGPKLERIDNTSFIYDYQLINKDGKLLEKRMLLEKNNRKRRKKNAKLEVRMSSEYLVYGPVGFLSQHWQDYFYYEIIGQEHINNVLTTVIRATPKPNNIDNRNFAQLWINEEDGSILQIDWQPESIIDHTGNQINFQALDIEVNVEWRVIYGIEKNGVRFPDLQHIQEFLVSEEGEKYIQNEIFIIYNNYKFFIVDTEVKYK